MRAGVLRRTAREGEAAAGPGGRADDMPWYRDTKRALTASGEWHALTSLVHERVRAKLTQNNVPTFADLSEEEKALFVDESEKDIVDHDTYRQFVGHLGSTLETRLARHVQGRLVASRSHAAGAHEGQRKNTNARNNPHTNSSSSSSRNPWGEGEGEGEGKGGGTGGGGGGGGGGVGGSARGSDRVQLSIEESSECAARLLVELRGDKQLNRTMLNRELPGALRHEVWRTHLQHPTARADYANLLETSRVNTISERDMEIGNKCQGTLDKDFPALVAHHEEDHGNRTLIMLMKTVLSYHHALHSMDADW